LVELDGRRLLIDAGPDLRQQMLREKVGDLDAVLLTHEHNDHIAGLDDTRAFSFVHEPPRDMPIYANAATLAAVQRVYSYAFTASRYPGVPRFKLHEVDAVPFHVAGVEVRPVQVMHLHMPVLGFRIGGLAYITDAKTIAPAEMEKLRGCKVLVVNALRKKEHISHFNLEEALQLIAELAPERAYLTHISHLMGLHADVALPPHVHLAYDGLKVEV
jgi:phosphoribosyl 1,2-cyclic phosphate phosphodiesterase